MRSQIHNLSDGHHRVAREDPRTVPGWRRTRIRPCQGRLRDIRGAERRRGPVTPPRGTVETWFPLPRATTVPVLTLEAEMGWALFADNTSVGDARHRGGVQATHAGAGRVERSVGSDEGRRGGSGSRRGPARRRSVADPGRRQPRDRPEHATKHRSRASAISREGRCIRDLLVRARGATRGGPCHSQSA